MITYFLGDGGLLLLLVVEGVWVSSERAAVCNRVVVKNEEIDVCVAVNALQLEKAADKLIATAAEAGKKRGFMLDNLCVV